MTGKLYSVQDVLTGFAQPFVMMNDEVAQRAYKDFLENDNHPEDKRLFLVGEFDDETGNINPINPVCIQGGGNNGKD